MDQMAPLRARGDGPILDAPMEHHDHFPALVPECPECQRLTYEPGWYRALQDDGVGEEEIFFLEDLFAEVDWRHAD